MRPTALSRRARELGLDLIPGQAMLYHQTERNFELLTGLKPPREHLDDAFKLAGFARP
jgi:shikimate 5-dehydrogenase